MKGASVRDRDDADRPGSGFGEGGAPVPIAAHRFSMQSLIDLVPDYLWVKDASSRFTIANKAIAGDSGFPSGPAMLGVSDFEIHDAESARRYRAVEQHVIESGQPIVDYEERVTDETGGTRWFSSTKIPLRDDAGSVVGLLGVSRDITQRKLAETLRDGQGRILEAIAMGAALDIVLSQIVGLVEAQLPGVEGAVLLLDDTRSGLTRGDAGAGRSAGWLEGGLAEVADGLCDAAIAARTPVGVEDIAAAPREAGPFTSLDGAGLRACWCVPILSQEKVLGVLALGSRQRFSREAAVLRHTELAIRLAAIAIDRKVAEDRIRFMASHDPLTKLPNRTLLYDRLGQATERALRDGTRACVVFVDLDGFKAINDQFGHQAGDDLLRAVAERLSAAVRPTDTVFRLGGDEFIVVLADQSRSVEALVAVVERVQAAIRGDGPSRAVHPKVHGSLGVALCPEDGREAGTLLAKADAAMYRAKARGRDTVDYANPSVAKEIATRNHTERGRTAEPAL